MPLGLSLMKKIGFLSFGHWTPSPQSQTRHNVCFGFRSWKARLNRSDASPGAGALSGAPLRDLSAREHLLDAACDRLASSRDSPGLQAEPTAVDPDDLVDISSVAGIVDENDLYSHPGHGAPEAAMNARRNTALLKAGEKPSVRKGAPPVRRDTARSKPERSSGSSRTVASPSLTRRR